MVDLSTLEAEEILIDERDTVLDYNSQFCSIFMDLERVKHNLYIVERLNTPRAPAKAGDSSNTISSNMIISILFMMNAYDINIIIISKLITSTGGSNLLRFRNSLIEKVKPQYRSSYIDRLKRSAIKADELDLTKRIINARNNIIAHNSDISFYPPDMSFLLPTQRRLYDAMDRACQAVTFKDPPIEWGWKVEDIDVDALL